MAAPRKAKALIKEINIFSENVRLFRIKPEKIIRNKFRAGQFLHLTLDEYDPSFNWPESRIFSIATSPGRADEIEIIVSKQGKYTTRMFNELKQGSEVWLKFPFGDFNFKETIGKKNILIAGGTGISPFISFLQQAIDDKEQPHIELYYGVRQNDVIIINELLNECNEKLQHFKSHLYIEQPLSVTDFDYSKGKLPVKQIVAQHANSKNVAFYISGPQNMIESVEMELNDQNVSPNKIFYDEWE